MQLRNQWKVESGKVHSLYRQRRNSRVLGVDPRLNFVQSCTGSLEKAGSSELNQMIVQLIQSKIESQYPVD
jgi:hypothetical protein